MRSQLHLVGLGVVAVVGLGLVVASLMAVRTFAQGSDPVSGAWELNLSKSTFSPGPPPKNQTRIYEFSGERLRYTAKGIDADGKPILVQYAAAFDGKDYPITGNADSDTISLKRIDGSTVASTQKKAGKVVITSTRTLSADRKVLTVHTRGTNVRGQAIDNVLVFDKR